MDQDWKCGWFFPLDVDQDSDIQSFLDMLDDIGISDDLDIEEGDLENSINRVVSLIE